MHRSGVRNIPLLVVGHGTRKPAGADQLRLLVETMRAMAPERVILESFLELAEPTISDALRRAKARGVTEILVVPVLLFSAAHAKSDIPNAVADEADRCGIQVIGQTPPLGTAESVLTLSDMRFHEVARMGPMNGCPTGHCARVRCLDGVCQLRGRSLGRLGLAMVGRGTSDTAALDHMRRLTQLCAERRVVDWFAAGFFAGSDPTVDALLEQASRAECDTVIVQPHLLFEGELMDQLRSKLLECSQRFSDKQWLLARCLGAETGLARVFLDIANESVAIAKENGE